MDYSDVRPVPKSACYALTQIIGAAVSLSEGTDMPLTLAEATHALDLAYPMKDRLQEMLYDGGWDGLAEPYSSKFALKTGVDLENKMIDEVCNLYTIRWWDNSKSRHDFELSNMEDALNILVTKKDAQAIWVRFWRQLGRDIPAGLDDGTIAPRASVEGVRCAQNDNAGSKTKADAAQNEKPLSTTERNTLLTIIAALCDYSAIDANDRGAASQIAKLTEDIGTAVSDDTVRRWLKLIPGALETRTK